MTHFDVAKLREDLIEYQEDMASPGFWDDTERAQRVSAHAHQTEMKIQHYETLVSRADDIEVNTTVATPFSRCTRARAAPRRRTGRRCSTACTSVTPSAWASK